MSALIAAKLEAVIPSLPAKDVAFATSLLKSAQKGSLSQKQEWWAEKLVARANGEEATATVEKVSVAGIISLLKGAGEKLKFPKIRLVTAGGHKVVFGIAGARSKYTGSVMITDGGPFGMNTYYGRISPEGEMVPSGSMVPEVMALVTAFAADPAGVGAAIGKRTGNCCFCLQKLETKESLAVGYGPTCAKNYNLPWG